MRVRAASAFLALALPALAGPAGATERPGRAALCPENLPEGVRLPPPPGCGTAARVPDGRPREDGFRDLGGGMSVRIGGRAGAEFGARR